MVELPDTTETSIVHIGGRILDKPAVSGHLFVAAKRTLTAPHFGNTSCTVVLVEYLPTPVTSVSSTARMFDVMFFFWSDQHRHT